MTGFPRARERRADADIDQIMYAATGTPRARERRGVL